MPEEKIKIVVERDECIGCGTCAAVCEKFFEMIDSGKAHLKNSKQESGKETFETISEPCLKEAVDACPVQCIHIK